MIKPLISICDLGKNYGDKIALRQFNLELYKGSIHGLIGLNGAGKTTLIRIINQIYKPDKGYILFNEEKLSQKHIQQIGYMPEERGLYMNMYLKEQLIYLGQLKGMNIKEAQRKIRLWLEYMDLKALEGEKISILSKGMAQKAQFIAAILHEPELIIFDEPFTGLDPINAGLIRKEILQLREKGHSILLSTHRIESAEGLCDEITFIDRACKILQGTPFSIKNNFKENSYYNVQIELHEENLWKDFLITHTISHIKKDENNCSFKLKKNIEDTTQELLKTLISIGEVYVFQQVMPTLEEVFIQIIKNSRNA